MDQERILSQADTHAYYVERGWRVRSERLFWSLFIPQRIAERFGLDAEASRLCVAPDMNAAFAAMDMAERLYDALTEKEAGDA